MKKGFLLVFLGLTAASSVVAQDRIVMLRDAVRMNLSVAELQKKYPPAFAQKAGEQGIFARQGKLFLDTVHAVIQRFYQYAETNKRRLPVLGVMVRTQEFIRPDGTYDRVFCDFSGRDLTDEQEGQLLQFVAEWYGQHPFPIKTKTGFRWESITVLGSVPPKRTVRHGLGTISTLEAAEKTTRPDTVTILAFNQLGLTQIPDVVYRFPKLEEIDLSKNKLNQLPARLTAAIPSLKRLSLLYNAIPNDSVFITRNKHLLALNLQGNKLTTIPAAVSQNRRLESLWMGNNKLSDLGTLRRLRRLNDLNLYNADLTQLPKAIARLKRLTVLDLYYNKLTSFPRQLSRLKRLEQLAVAHNDLQQLPASLAKLHRLRVLFTHHNRLSQFPAEFSKLKNLHVLDVSYNWFSVVPNVLATLPHLEELDLNNNNLQEFPDVLLSIKSLKKVYMGSNPIFGREALQSPYAAQIKQLEANNTQVTY